MLTMQAPVLFRGIAQSVPADAELVRWHGSDMFQAEADPLLPIHACCKPCFMHI